MPDPSQTGLRTQDRTTPVRIPLHLRAHAAARFVQATHASRLQAAKRMLAAAASHGLDMSLIWGTVDPHPSDTDARVGEACLAVPGAGRSATLLVSAPERDSHGPISGHGPRVACIRAACDGLTALPPSQRVVLAQALPDPDHTAVIAALTEAGFITVGELAYLQRPVQAPPPVSAWPSGVTVRAVVGVGPGEPDRVAMLAALECSYEDTLDCPELCGLRTTSDVLESHRAAGAFDPNLWWLVFHHDQPAGCLLLSQSPEHDTVELVYLGVARSLRGMGLGRALLSMGLNRLHTRRETSIGCAVDLRNQPAIRLYKSLDFREISRKIAMVRPLGDPASA
ncbi:MAG: GNAT family N-acetyltransferase [Phycisphaerales bacterium]